ncbi:MAG: PAS domain S-box protein [Armatimonadota bacterium]|nr:PAS domain S-box protein [Armatimonadota bacterium]
MSEKSNKCKLANVGDVIKNICSEVLINSPISIWILDKEGTLIFENKACRRLLGIESDEEVVGKYNIFKDNEIIRQGFASKIRQVFEDGGSIEFIIEYDLARVRHISPVHPGRKILRMFVFAIKDAEDKVCNVVVQHEDYTSTWRATKSLEVSEAQYREVVEGVSDWVWEIDVDGRIKFTNPAVEQILGYKPNEIIGRVGFDFVIPADREHVEQIFLSAIRENREITSVQTRFLHKDGSIRFLETNARPMFDENGKVIGLRGISRAMTERKKVEEQLKYRMELERVIVELSTKFINLPPEEIDAGINRALGVIGSFIGADRSFVFLISEDGKTVSNVYEWCAEGVEPTIHLFQNMRIEDYPLMKKGLAGYEPVIIPRVSEMPPEYAKEREVFESEDVKSFIALPMISQGVSIGFLGFETVKEEKTWSEDSVVLLKILGEILANALDRKKTEEALMEAESKYRSLVEESLVGVYIIQNGKLIYVNPRAAEIFGYTPDEVIEKKTALDLTAPESRALVAENISKRIRGEVKSIHYTFKGLKKDGSIIDVEVYGTRTTFKGKPAIIGTLLDITERVKAEERRLELERQKREFYRKTILAATQGKLVISEKEEIEKIAGKPIASWEIKSGKDLGIIRHEVAKLAETEGMDQSRIYDFVLCVGELTTNALKHAGSGTASLHRLDDRLMFVVADRGPGIEALVLPEVALVKGYSTAGTLGMGYKAVLTVADKVYLATGHGGTTVAVEMSLRPSEHQPAMANIPNYWANCHSQ